VTDMVRENDRRAADLYAEGGSDRSALASGTVNLFAPVPRMLANISQCIRARRLCCSARISGLAQARAEERVACGFGVHLSSPGCRGYRRGRSY
jgi:hypothetical protein